MHGPRTPQNSPARYRIPQSIVSGTRQLRNIPSICTRSPHSYDAFVKLDVCLHVRMVHSLRDPRNRAFDGFTVPSRTIRYSAIRAQRPSSNDRRIVGHSRLTGGAFAVRSSRRQPRPAMRPAARTVVLGVTSEWCRGRRTLVLQSSIEVSARFAARVAVLVDEDS